MNLKYSQRLVIFVLFFKFHGTLPAAQCFVRENEMMPRNIKDSQSIARTMQCSSWASSCRTETCFSIITLLHRKQNQICETLANVCACWATAFVWCIFLHCPHFTLPQFFAQNLQKPKHRFLNSSTCGPQAPPVITWFRILHCTLLYKANYEQLS